MCRTVRRDEQLPPIKDARIRTHEAPPRFALARTHACGTADLVGGLRVWVCACVFAHAHAHAGGWHGGHGGATPLRVNIIIPSKGESKSANPFYTTCLCCVGCHIGVGVFWLESLMLYDSLYKKTTPVGVVVTAMLTDCYSCVTSL